MDYIILNHMTANAPNKKAKSKTDKKSAATKEEQSMENCDIIAQVGYIIPNLVIT